jgi:hypothetical protein
MAGNISAVVLRKQIVTLVDQRRQDRALVEELRAAVGCLQRDLAGERALRRLTESRRAHPHDQAFVVKLAERKSRKAREQAHNA